MTLQVRDPAGVVEVTAGRCRVSARVKANDGTDRLAVARGRALEGPQALLLSSIVCSNRSESVIRNEAFASCFRYAWYSSRCVIVPSGAPGRTGFGVGAWASTEYCTPLALENRLPNALSRGRKNQYGACKGRLNTTRPTSTAFCSLSPTCAPLDTGSSPMPRSTLLTDQNLTGG